MEKYFVKSIESKLMLCSRDEPSFNVDDVLIHKKSNKKIIYGSGIAAGGNGFFYAKGELHDYGLNRHHKSAYFKIIGEISKDAYSYVKEGDEFDDLDLSVESHVYTPLCFYVNNYPIYIKCPTCKTFH